MADSPTSQSGERAYSAGSNTPECTTMKRDKALLKFVFFYKIKSEFKQLCGTEQVHTYLARVVRMLYARVSTLRTATILLPCGSDVWTSSCNPVKSLPSCSITVFSTLSCWSAACVASPTHQEHGIKEVKDLLSMNLGRGVKWFPTWFINCFVFLSGDKPIHLIEHSVNLWDDQQLQCKEKSEWWSWRECCCHCYYKHSLLLWLQSLYWLWQSDTDCPPPYPDHTQNQIIDT